MTYEEIVTNAKQDIGKYCKACMVCNGRACRNQMPGPGAKGMGDTAIRNFDKWQEIRVQMDTISEHEEVDTSFVLWGQRFRYPFFDRSGWGSESSLWEKNTMISPTMM